MSGWSVRKVFWTTVQVEREAQGWVVALDGRRMKTPAKAALVLPTEGLARLVAAEWAGQKGKIDPATMPATRMANSAIDKVTPHHAAIAAMLADYGDCDLLCYRASAPAALTALEEAAWGPLLDWAAKAFGITLVAVQGVMHLPQDGAGLQRLAAQVGALDPFQLAAFHDLVAISGSLILAFAVIRGRLTAEDAWALARLEEEWQAAQWGDDPEARAASDAKRAEFLGAARFFALCGAPGLPVR